MAWSQKTVQRFQVRTELLIQNVINWAQDLDDNMPPQWCGPSLYFHKVLITSANNTQELTLRLQDNRFLERLYACLASWGLQRLDNPKASLVCFRDFETQVRGIVDPLMQFVGWRLEDVTQDQFGTILNTLNCLMDNLKIVVAGWPFVGNTKLLHHLLPHLIPPMDRNYTLRYFLNWTSDERNTPSYTFERIFRSFWQVATANRDALRHMPQDTWTIPAAFNTTIPKIIDNAIIVGVRNV